MDPGSPGPFLFLRNLGLTLPVHEPLAVACPQFLGGWEALSASLLLCPGCGAVPALGAARRPSGKDRSRVQRQMSQREYVPGGAVCVVTANPHLARLTVNRLGADHRGLCRPPPRPSQPIFPALHNQGPRKLAPRSTTGLARVAQHWGGVHAAGGRSAAAWGFAAPSLVTMVLKLLLLRDAEDCGPAPLCALGRESGPATACDS